MMQYDLFGELRELPKKIKKHRPSRKFKTMQELHGYKDGETCKTCRYCKSIRFNKVYWKCEKWRLSHSSATDIRLKNKACCKWEKKI